MRFIGADRAWTPKVVEVNPNESHGGGKRSIGVRSIEMTEEDSSEHRYSG